jgi:hypothetical protein
MPIRSGYLPSTDELLRSADITPSDIANATRQCDKDVPRLRPAWHAELIDPADDPGPIPDPD